jgi:hypothetical protein
MPATLPTRRERLPDLMTVLQSCELLIASRRDLKNGMLGLSLA